jgi:N-acyl-D-amino-acid deacylase
MPPEAGSKFDLVIRHGLVVDGTGAPSFAADVAVAGDRIAAVGKVADRGARPDGRSSGRTIDASGLVVAPGFIDVHTHDDLGSTPRPSTSRSGRG